MTGDAAALVAAGVRQLLEQYCGKLNDEGFEVIRKHAATLWLWNQKMNLVGDLSVDGAIYRHYGESVFLASFLPCFGDVVDYGSGAGFPGVGIAALFPAVSLSLIEVRQKRAAFLREAFRGSLNVRVSCGDATRFPGPVSLVVSRAVNISEIVEFAGSRNAQLLALVGQADGLAWKERIELGGGRCALAAVPWRKESCVLRAGDLGGFVRSKTG